MSNITNLIVLPCHSIWKGGETLGESRDEWSLVSFQIQGHDHLCFKNHITESLKLLADDKNAYLIISGGQTKAECGPISESQSYYQLARELASNLSILERTTTEEFARDSFENVMFSICRFYEVHQKYPERITVVGFEFKRARFVNHHLNQALKIPIDKIRYVGNEPTPTDLDEQERIEYFRDLEQSEYRFAVQHFANDYYGTGDHLLKKKLSRNPFHRNHGYIQSNPKLSTFLEMIRDGTDCPSSTAIKFLNNPVK